jgi:hypothetical protein
VLEKGDSVEPPSLESSIGVLEQVSTKELIFDHHTNMPIFRASSLSKTSWKLQTNFS